MNDEITHLYDVRSKSTKATKNYENKLEETFYPFIVAYDQETNSSKAEKLWSDYKAEPRAYQ